MPALHQLSFLDHPFWGRGFRPFFLMGAIYTVISLLIWSGFYAGLINPPGIMADPVVWHAHEMIYGFGMAIVAGFLLTAVANWTGGAPVQQIHLIALCLLWLAGRVAMNVQGLPAWLMIVAEISFIPALAVSLALPLIHSKNTRNFVFLGILSVLLICDLTFLVTQSRMPLYLALLLIVMMISLIGGRIIPAFTVAVLRRAGMDARIRDQPGMDKLALLSLVSLGAAFVVFGTQSFVTGSVAMASFAIHLLRMRQYHSLKALRDPMLWILHAGFGWLVAGLFILGLSGFGIGSFPVAIHALTVGSIGSMTLGMMCRVTLGHTGRDLVCGFVTVASFALMQMAAIMRVFGPLFIPDHYTFWVVGSGVLWAGCFALYLGCYALMLLQPRPDGQAA